VGISFILETFFPIASPAEFEEKRWTELVKLAGFVLLDVDGSEELQVALFLGPGRYSLKACPTKNLLVACTSQISASS
jgi:hypothetical protein